MAALNKRRARLLDAIRRESGVWTTSRAHRINRANDAPKKTTTRGDLEALYRAGLLDRGGPDDHRFYLPPGAEIRDLEQADLAKVEAEFERRAHTANPWTFDEFLDRIEAVHDRYARVRMGAAS